MNADRDHVVSVSPREMLTVEPPILTYRGLCTCGWKSGQFRTRAMCNEAAYQHIRESGRAALAAPGASESVPAGRTAPKPPESGFCDTTETVETSEGGAL